MADETTGTPAAKSGSAGLSRADVAAIVGEAMRESKASPFGPASQGPTERVRSVAAGIKAGKSVEAAMTDAGYGRRYIAGNAAGFPTLLAKYGLLTDAQAKKATGAVLVRGGA